MDFLYIYIYIHIDVLLDLVPKENCTLYNIVKTDTFGVHPKVQPLAVPSQQAWCKRLQNPLISPLFVPISHTATITHPIKNNSLTLFKINLLS